MPDPVVLYEVDDKVSVITLNRPEKLNAISPELRLALTHAFTRADADPGTSVVLLRAEGRSFCAGYDIGTAAETYTPIAPTEVRGKAIYGAEVFVTYVNPTNPKKGAKNPDGTIAAGSNKNFAFYDAVLTAFEAAGRKPIRVVDIAAARPDLPIAAEVRYEVARGFVKIEHRASAREPGTDDWRSDPTKAHDHLHPQLEFEMLPWTMKKPVIASVQGHVMGGGCELVMLCDLTIAADNATFGEPEVRFSSVGPAIVMPMIIGYKKARELLYFGDTIDAEAALALGMVNRVVPLAELREASLRWAKRLSLISPEALYAAKRAVNRGADAAGFRTALYAGLDVVGPLYATKTEFGQRFREIVAREGVPAAVRWRAAQFRE
jgi:enoyl-CoA hydratase/carnithine racemase